MNLDKKVYNLNNYMKIEVGDNLAFILLLITICICCTHCVMSLD